MSEKARKNKALLFMEIAVNILGVSLLFLATWFIAYRYNLNSPFLYKKGTALLVGIYFTLYLLFCNIYDGHNVGHLRVSEIIYSQFLSILIVNIITFFQVCLIDRRIVAVKPMIFLTGIDLLFIVFWAYWANRRFQKRNPTQEMIIIYGHKKMPGELIQKMNAYDYKFKIAAVVSESEGLQSLTRRIGTHRGVALCRVSPILRKKLIKYCFEHSVPCYIIPNTSDIIVRGAETVNLLDTPLLLCNNGEISLVESFLKRCFDLVFSFLGLLVLSPVLLLAACAVKLEDGGPIIFSQERLTIHGKRFHVYKFRSMIPNAEKDGIARLAKENDNRITHVGKWIRRLRIDEIPQLFNILKGDMSLVGPRPERPEIAAQYRKNMREFDYRLRVKAGLTGYAQVMGRYNTTPFDKLMLDMMYIEQYSLFLDLKLILMTIKILFLPESTEGVGEHETTASKTEING